MQIYLVSSRDSTDASKTNRCTAVTLSTVFIHLLFYAGMIDRSEHRVHWDVLQWLSVPLPDLLREVWRL